MTQLAEQEIRTQIDLAARWKRNAGLDDRLFSSCYELLEAARQLERDVSARRSDDVSARRSEGPTAAALGCLGEAFESLANASLMLRDEVDPEPNRPPSPGAADDQAAQVAQLLFAIDQNLRFAAHAAGLGRETLTVGDTTGL